MLVQCMLGHKRVGLGTWWDGEGCFTLGIEAFSACWVPLGMVWVHDGMERNVLTRGRSIQRVLDHMGVGLGT